MRLDWTGVKSSRHESSPVSAKSKTFAELQRWHVAQHHRYFVGHLHAGPNHPDERPPGWYTGEDVVPRR